MNRKSVAEHTQILRCLVEGNSIRSTSRITGASRNTITKLMLDAGQACAEYQSKTLRNLSCERIQVDEIWSFVYAKRKNVTPDMPGTAGDVWVWVAMDPDTKLVATWLVGTRDAESANLFIADLASRLNRRIQLTSDGYKKYENAVESAFGAEIDYAMMVKNYDSTSCQTEPPVGIVIRKVIGAPDPAYVSTSYVERQNLTMRMGMRRFTRKTNGFSKKIENHAYMIALHYMYYNFVRIHQTLRVTPAMESGVADKLWCLEDIIELTYPTRVLKRPSSSVAVSHLSSLR